MVPAPSSEQLTKDDTAEYTSTPAILGVVVGSAAFVAMIVVSVCLYAKMKSQKRSHAIDSTRLLMPKTVKPVISFKTAAGPGGLKKSPSPVQSPDSTDSHLPSIPKSASGGFSTELGIPTSHRTHSTHSLPAGEIRGFAAGLGSGDKCLANITEIDENKENVCRKDAHGSLGFTLRYSFDKNALTVIIVGACNLMPAKRGDKKSGSDQSPETVLDPYVKLALLPEKQHKVKTRVVRNTLNPSYEEEFTFYGLNYDHLQSTTLHFAVVGFDRYSRDEIVGEVVFPLDSIDWGNSEEQISFSKPLINRSLKFQNTQNRGELLVSLCHQPATGRLTAVVLKARNLPKVDITGLADPYVKAYLLYNGQRIAKKKSHVKKRTLHPVYNESFVFDLPCNEPDLSGVSLEFLVMDWDRVTKSEVMGRTEIGARAKHVQGRKHWEQVCHAPRRQVAEWHKLRP